MGAHAVADSQGGYVAAVIQRVVTSPVKTEFLSSGPGELEVWGEKSDAFVFKTHALADAVASKMREAARVARHETGQLGACFVHARTLENDERDDFARSSLGSRLGGGTRNGRNGRAPALPADPAKAGKLRSEVGGRKSEEFAIRMDPRRAAEVLRDPVEVD